MSEREFPEYDKDPMVNAVLNVAEAIHELARAHTQLLYAFKYSKEEGMSVAEAIEVGLGKLIPTNDDRQLAEAIEGLNIAVDEGSSRIAEALSELTETRGKTP